MTEDEFWSLVDGVNTQSGGSPDAKEAALRQRLDALDAPAVASFSNHMDAMMDRAYAWNVWAAAYVIHGGCSDDSFMDFRSCLIFLGRQAYESACANPDSLAALDDTTLEATEHEGLLYIAGDVHEAKAGGHPERARPHPSEPSGDEWDEDDEQALATMCPELWKRFG